MSSETFVEEEFLGPEEQFKFDEDGKGFSEKEDYITHADIANLGASEDREVGDAFRALDPNTESGTQVQERANKRIAAEVPSLKEENELLKIKLGDALKSKTPGGETKTPPSALSRFTSMVGESFTNMAAVIPNKIQEIASDPIKKKNLIRGLQIINESSGIKPIGQAKSTFGMIGAGLLKAEKQFTAEEIAFEKAKKKEPRRYPSPNETLLIDSMKDYKKRQQFKKDMKKSVNDRFNIVRKVALEGNEVPTGVLNKSFRDLKGIIQELGLGEKYDALAKKIGDEDYIKKNGNKMDVAEQNEFNDLFQAATFEQVVQDVKKLYPVSNKDIDTLLKTKGDISTRPEALRKLVATQMAINDIAMQSEDYAYKYFELGDQQFEKKSIRMSEKMIGEKLRKEGKVTSETLKQLFGTDKDITDAGYITAHYYQQLLAQKDDGAGDPFKIFITAEKNKEKIKKDKIKKYQ